jgi:DNA (cytosine-5)-methyltransferase 1
VAAAVECDPVAALTYMVNLARPGVKIHFDGPDREQNFTAVLERHLGIRPRRGRQAADGRAGRHVIAGGSLAGDGWIASRPVGEPGCDHFFLADARRLSGQQILDALGLAAGEVDVVVGGPPCQGFSKANSNRSVMDPRNSLVFEFTRLVVEIRPKAMVMENVPEVASMLTPDGVPVIDAMARVLADGGFSGYDALRASLAARAGAGAVLRRDAPRGRRGASKADPARRGQDRGAQLSLLDDLEAGQ